MGRRIETKQGKDYVQKLDYDDLGRVFTETFNQPGVKAHKLTRFYNDAGKPSGIEWNQGKEKLQVNYGYHSSGCLNTISDGETKVTCEYLANSNLIQHTTYHNKHTPTMRTAKQYDRLGRLLETTTRRQSDTAILSSHQYTYNLANQRAVLYGFPNGICRQLDTLRIARRDDTLYLSISVPLPFVLRCTRGVPRCG